ncbi:uncharacterized protein LOC110096460 [Dendrobium catenatum]|uniref:DNA polymerase delta subunit 4 n=1 Tax=Dendrobium catenatum TaxID=906689 RepID=A0A2I0WIZ6_9ASPA|nr:uncharacterized protein LOC110096460 [Dendrobium catenatum]PKU75634.1 hypothetical protein MA16_Dca021411 [Dendrobium catenatum]
MASADIKGYFRQKKGGVSKKLASSSRKKSGKSSVGTICLPEPTETPSLTAHGKFDRQDEYGDGDEKLKQFDMDMRYGPCVGISRLERWKRACSMGLNPPPEIGNLLRTLSKSNPKLECLWEGRV